MTTLTQEVFACMGNTADLTVIGDPSLLGIAQIRLGELEQRWSRFISSSDVCALNQSKGVAISVHPDTITLVRYLVDAQCLTNRFFDPTLLPSLVQLGYARSMTNASLVTLLDGSLRWGEPLVATSIDIENSTVTLPAGLTLDPGGLGKGLAADIVASELRELGAEGVCVSIGGDIRCSGTGPIDGAWSIPVASPFVVSAVLAMATLLDGAYHDVDSSEMAFKIAGSIAYKEASRLAQPTLLEPLMAVEVRTPEEYMGDVIGDLNSRRGQIQAMDDASGVKVVRALVPLSEMFGYVGDLRSKTSGRAVYSMTFETYAEVPKAVADEIVQKNKGE